MSWTLGVDKKTGGAGMMGRRVDEVTARLWRLDDWETRRLEDEMTGWRGDCETGVTGWLGNEEIEWRGEKLSETTVVRCQL